MAFELLQNWNFCHVRTNHLIIYCNKSSIRLPINELLPAFFSLRAFCASNRNSFCVDFPPLNHYYNL